MIERPRWLPPYSRMMTDFTAVFLSILSLCLSSLRHLSYPEWIWSSDFEFISHPQDISLDEEEEAVHGIENQPENDDSDDFSDEEGLNTFIVDGRSLFMLLPLCIYFQINPFDDPREERRVILVSRRNRWRPRLQFLERMILTKSSWMTMVWSPSLCML